MPARKGTAPHLGLLELPVTWLHQLVPVLSAKDRLALFQACMQLATQVLASAPTKTLNLCEETPGADMVKRCKIIKKLLTGVQSAGPGQNFKLVVTNRGAHPPFPALLSSQVTELWLQFASEHPVSLWWLRWSLYTNLRRLQLSGVLFEADTVNLCDALEAGHLPQLSEFHGGPVDNLSDWRPNKIGCTSVQRLVRALAPRVRSFHAESNLWFHVVQRLTALETITVSYKPWFISQGSTGDFWIHMLCEHPSIHTVWLESYSLVNRNHYEQTCKWKTLHLVGEVHINTLMQLPLPVLQEVHIHHGFDANDICRPEINRAVKFVVNNHLNKAQIRPTWDSKECRLVCTLRNVTPDTATIISALKTDCWLYLRWIMGHQEPDAALVPAIWAALHPSVTSVRLTNITGVDWSSFWAGIPQTVRRIELWDPDFGRVDTNSTAVVPDSATQAMFDLVAGAPAHLPSLRLINISPYLQVRWKEAGLAPAHLKFIISHAPFP